LNTQCNSATITPMNRKIAIIMITAVVFSLAIGIYDFVLPLFLEAKHLSTASMGLIFGLAAVLLFVVRIAAGSHSDAVGRKPFYSASLMLCAVSNALTPLFPAVLMQTVFKTMREAASVVWETMRMMLVFESAPDKFMAMIAKVAGMEFIVQGLGTFGAGFMIAHYGLELPFYLCAVILAMSYLYFERTYKETAPILKPESGGIDFRELFRFDLPPKLVIVSLSFFIFSFGLSMSHSFFMPLFFMRKFNAGPEMTAFIMAIHRLTLGLAIFFYGSFFTRNLKTVYILAAIYEGTALAVSALIPSFTLATIIWLTHDIIGGAFVNPLWNTFIQKYARPEKRGKDVSMVQAIYNLGWIFGPIVAGVLVPISVNAPFFISGVIAVLSSFIILWL
jgi:MFS family permease